MRPEDWIRVKSLFEAALEKPTAEQAAFLEGIPELDPEMRREVERLLAADRDDSFLEGFTESATLPSEPTGPNGDSGMENTRIGPYRLLEMIGRGGMGTVYLGVRDDDEYRKRVAVKLLRKGMDSEDIVRRFRNERQILAAVEHANIAKLYDGGTTEDGSPYFVMELVEGLPLDEYCDTHRLTIRERLELFRQVCAAVQVAHQNLVVHRDLKPSNILVTTAGEPKLLDFGIAKLLNPDLAAATLHQTQFQAGPMTPAYASPEQVRSEPITTASDVYSLGVILYELLTGHRPYQIPTQSLSELTRVVSEVEPTRPSQMIERQEEVSEADGSSRKLTPETISRTRGASAEKLRRRLSGDLDNIVLMALRKEPQRRYASVEQFSEDIERHLDGRPVRARKPTLAYRSSKFIQRHRAGLAAAAIFLVLLLGFTVVTVRARMRAEREAVKAQAINDFLQRTLAAADPVSGVSRDVTVAEALDRAVLELDSSFASEPEVRAAIQKTIGSTYQELGRLEGAEPLLVSALETRKAIFGDAHEDVADSLHDLAYLKDDQGEYEESERLYRQALELHRRLGGENEKIAKDLGGLATVLYRAGDYEAAESLQREALSLLRRLSSEQTRELSNALNNLALTVEAKGDFEEAEKLYRQSLTIDRERLGDEHPDVATTMSNLGLLISDTRGDEAAEPYLREALAIRRKTLGEHPDTAVSMSSLAVTLSANGDAAGAERLLREALAMQRQLIGDEHTDICATLNNLAGELAHAGKFEEAETLYREAIAIRRQEVGDIHPDLAINISNLAKMLAEKGDDVEAEALHREACSIFDKVHGADHWTSAYCGSIYGAFLTKAARYDEAEALLLKSHSVLRETLGEEHDRTIKTIERLVDLYQAVGKTDKAAEYRALLPATDGEET